MLRAKGFASQCTKLQRLPRASGENVCLQTFLIAWAEGSFMGAAVDIDQQKLMVVCFKSEIRACEHALSTL
jgi:hypothetical protein